MGALCGSAGGTNRGAHVHRDPTVTHTCAETHTQELAHPAMLPPQCERTGWLPRPVCGSRSVCPRCMLAVRASLTSTLSFTCPLWAWPVGDHCNYNHVPISTTDSGKTTRAQRPRYAIGLKLVSAAWWTFEISVIFKNMFRAACCSK